MLGREPFWYFKGMWMFVTPAMLIVSYQKIAVSFTDL